MSSLTVALAPKRSQLPGPQRKGLGDHVTHRVTPAQPEEARRCSARQKSRTVKCHDTLLDGLTTSSHIIQ